MSTRAFRILTDGDAAGRCRLERDDPAKTGPLFFSSGLLDLACGACAFLLIKGWLAAPEALQDVVIVCPNCLQLNGL